MKKQLRIAFLICLLAFMAGMQGCGNKDSVIYRMDSTSNSLSTEVVMAGSVETPEVITGSDPPEQEEGTESLEEAKPEMLCVYVCGAVKNPGVYQLPEGSRVYQALAAAGGLLENADPKCLNQASLLTDGLQITVYTREEAEEMGLNRAAVLSTEQTSGQGTASSAGQSGNGEQVRKVNINTAGKEELMTLPGIGEARADQIMQYREENGRFSSIDEIQQISGIKQKAFDKIKDYIEV